MKFDEVGLNKENPSIMWIDLNSAFATAEQQAHPTLRGKPIGITNRVSKECCIIAASYEAKNLGIKVGMRRTEAMQICPKLILLETNPPRYNHVYSKLFSILKDYTHSVKMKSIDEGVLDFHNTGFEGKTDEIVRIGYEIKKRVREEIGDFMMINVGIGSNRFLAKTAAGLNKPDGLNVIDHTNLMKTYESLELQDLCGIAQAYSWRLKSNGINTTIDFLNAKEEFLNKVVFKSINGAYWFRRLRGYEIDASEKKLGMVGRQWIVKNPTANEEYIRSCLHYLAETIGIKLRFRDAEARGVCVWAKYVSGGGFQDKKMFSTACYSDKDIWRRVSEGFDRRDRGRKIKMIGIYLYGIKPSSRNQPDLFGIKEKSDNLTDSLDSINDFYGLFTVYSADSMIGSKNIKQKIPFGGTEYFNLLLKK